LDVHTSQTPKSATLDTDDDEVIPGHLEFGSGQTEQLRGDAKFEETQTVVGHRGD
jgi:hypothetical protein